MSPCAERADADVSRAAGGALLVVAVLLVAVNLRPAIASVGPLLDEARGALGASAAWAGSLTTIPVLCFAGAGLVAPALVRRLGLRVTIGVALALVGVGLVVRVVGGPVLMLVATVVAAGGIAVAGVLIPVVVRTSFPARVGLLTGLYTAALQAGAAVAFALSPRLAVVLGGWRPALGSWAVLAAVALAVWLVGGPRRAPGSPPAAGSGRSLWRSPLAWTVTAFFGLQAFVAFAVIGWLAQVLLDAGVGREDAGVLMGLLTIVALPVSLLVPPLATRRRAGPSGWIVGLGACGLAGAGGFLVAPGAAPLLWALLLGLGMSVFSLALTVIALRARTGEDTARLSGMAQGVGYLIAGAGPLAFGIVHDLTGGWRAPLAMLLVVIAAQTVTGALAGRPRHV
ncbi:MFS transporter [Pseudonocardia acaciae]|uniref:MFS transporter n=1 Tax=Pseudonocardia acaciae TaxID=551276 RepID=UPI000684102C|nr:MFS transporter [Pseudonocardia acaciae]